MSSDYAVIIGNNTETGEVVLLVDCFFYDKELADKLARETAAKLTPEWEIRVCDAYCRGFYSGSKV